MKRRTLLAGAAGLCALAAPGARAANAWPVVQVFRSPHCGCCGAWVDHLKAAGLPVAVTMVEDTTAARRRLGMPDAYGSCHSASVGGYAIEGHVPADEVKRLLAARPAALGLAVPSMPPGSPGMEVGARRDPYQVLLIDRAGRASVYASYPKAAGAMR